MPRVVKRQRQHNKMWVSDREAQRLRALGAVFAKTNRILTRDKAIRVTMQDARINPGGVGVRDKTAHKPINSTPGYSLYPNIYINYNWFSDYRSKQTLVELLGLNYHELSHIMFSPRKFKGELTSGDRREAYAILEDQRIESMFTAMYEPAGKYFTQMIVKIFVNDERAWQSAFLWTYGRSYLPLEIRDEFELRFALDAYWKRKAKNVIDEYKALDPSDFKYDRTKVVGILDRFVRILNKLKESASMPRQNCEGNEDSEGQPNEKVHEQAKQEETQRREREKETGEDQSGFWDDEDEEDEDESSESEDDGEGDDPAGQSDESGDDSDSGEDEEGEADGGASDEDDDSESSEGDGSDEPSDSDESDEGTGEGDGDADSDSDSDGADSDDGDEGGSESASDHDESEQPQSGDSDGLFDDDELSEYLRDIVDAVNEDDSVDNEIGRIQNALNNPSIDFIDFGTVPHNNVEPSVGVQQEVKQITQEYRRLFAEVEPGWLYGSDAGKLNVGRAINDPENYDEMFDEWDEGREHDYGLEVFISGDISGSMSGYKIQRMSEATWAIKRALDEVDAKTTIVGFHATTKGLYSRDEKAARNEFRLWTQLGGSTLPAQSFHIGRRVLSLSEMPNKLFICITDGGWGAENREGENSYEDLNELIDAIPATKIYVGIDGAGARNYEQRQRFDFAIDLGPEVGQLTQVTRLAVTKMLRERRR